MPALEIANPKIAFVYPPYGPPNLASLGIANLQAGIRARGFECRAFYWAYRWMQELPVAPELRRATYHHLTRRDLSPWNEWAFARSTFPDALGKRDSDAEAGLAQLDRDVGASMAPVVPSELLHRLMQECDERLAPVLEDVAPYDVIGVTSTFFQSGAALALCKAVKERWPEKLTVLGGANCDGEMGRALVEHFPFVDFAFSGEVDFEVPRFVQCLHDGSDYGEVRGLCYRDESGSVVESEAAVPVIKMDELPGPDFDDWVDERKRYGLYESGKVCLPLESSRGCWWGAKHHCTFCGLNAGGMSYRQKTPERFQQEVEQIVDRYGATHLFMADNILSTDYYRSFLPWAREQGLGIEIFYEIKSNMTRKVVGELADAGIHLVQPGIESFSSEVLARMRKGVKGIQNVAFLKYGAERGVVASYNILAGFPGEDPEDYRRTARALRKLVHLKPPSTVAEIEFHRFSPYHDEPASFGIELRPHDKYGFIFPLPESELSRLAYQFVLANSEERDLSYLGALRRVVGWWQESFEPQGCALEWAWDGEDIVVHDRREGFVRKDYRLRDHAVPAFLEFETPRRIPRAVEGAALRAADIADVASAPRSTAAATVRAEEVIVRFDRARFEDAPLECLEPLRSAGLFWEEGDSLLNLAVTATRDAAPTGWDEIQVP